MNRITRYTTDALILLGAGAVVAGVAWIHVPSGLILGGLLLAFLAILGGTHGNG